MNINLSKRWGFVLLLSNGVLWEPSSAGGTSGGDVVVMVRTVEARGARDVAKRALETTGQIFRYAIAHGYANRNAGHLGRLGGRQIKSKTTQKMAKSGLGNLRKTKITVNLLHGNMLTPLKPLFSS